MIAAIHQPNYIPWLGFFYKVSRCDIFIVLDNVQFIKRGVTHRNKIKTPDGELWVVLPVQNKGSINEIRLKNNIDWREMHLNYYVHNYRRTKYFEQYFPDLKKIYKTDWEYMSDLNMEVIKYILNELGIRKQIVFASSLKPQGKGTELLIDICKQVGADTYLSGKGGKKYMDEARFFEEDIKLVYSDFVHPVYPQLWRDFIPNLSILDLLFNCGNRSQDYALAGGAHEKDNMDP